MGLFSFDSDDKKEKSSGEDFATPKNPSDTKSEQIRKMGGFDSIGDVAKAAPTKTGDAAQGTSAALRTSSRSGARQTKASKEEEEKQRKLEQKRRAIQTLGKRYAKWLAENPYKLWSAYADDPFLALNKEESEELTAMYFELAEALEPDLTSWYVIVFGILAMNTSLVTVRLKHIKAMEEDILPPKPGAPLKGKETPADKKPSAADYEELAESLKTDDEQHFA